MAELNPEDFNYFRTKRRQVQSTYDLGSAQNQAQRSMAANQYTRNVGDLAYAYGRAREKHGWSHGARGIQNSGIERKDLYDLGMEGWVRPAANMAGQYQDIQNQFSVAQQQLGRQLGEGFQDIDDAKAARLAMEQIAAAIRAAGGY